MKATLTQIGLVIATIGVMTFSNGLKAQTAATSTTVQTRTGSFSEFVPDSNVVVLRSESGSVPVRYSITRTTRIVDPAGNPLTVEKIPAGSPLSVEYEVSGDQMVAERIVVQRATGGPASVVREHQTTTVTTTNRPMTEDEIEARNEAAEEQAEAREEMREELENARD